MHPGMDLIPCHAQRCALLVRLFVELFNDECMVFILSSLAFQFIHIYIYIERERDIHIHMETLLTYLSIIIKVARVLVCVKGFCAHTE